MVAVVSLLAVVTIALTITRVATIVLVHTGLSRESARFQARSAFSGAGFTTSESEDVVNHPVRRRVISTLVLMGSAGIVTTIASLLLTFTGADSSQAIDRIVVLLLGLVGLYLLSRSTVVDRAVTHATQWALRRYTKLDLRDYARLLHVSDDYAVAETEVVEGDWLCGHRLDELQLRQEGVIVLGIYRKSGEYLGVPVGTVRLNPGDVIVVYGADEHVAELSQRPGGDAGWAAHEEAVQRYTARREEERERQDDTT